MCIVSPRSFVAQSYADDSFALEERVPRMKTKISLDHKGRLHGPGGNLSAVIEAIPSLQGPRGGFGKPNPSLLATSRALFLSRLYGTMGRIDTKRAADYVRAAAAEAQVSL